METLSSTLNLQEEKGGQRRWVTCPWSHGVGGRPKTLSPQLLCPDSKRILLPVPHSCYSLFAWMPPGNVMKTNYSLVLWFLSPLDKLPAYQCAWQVPMETKDGKKRSSSLWLKPLTECSSPILSSLGTLADKCEALCRVKPYISVRLKGQLMSYHKLCRNRTQAKRQWEQRSRLDT